MDDAKAKQRKINDSILLDDTTREAMRVLNEGVETKPTIDLDLFVRTFLPALGQEHDEPLDMNPWLAISKGPYNPVDVVSNGSVVFTVPPLLNRRNTRINENSKDSLTTIAVVAKQKGDAHPMMGQNYLRQGLLSYVGRERVNPEALQEWNRVLVKYGYDPIELDAVPSSNKKPNIATASLYGDDVDEL
mgnify:FL=1|tara:strand:+ start:1152 stop:1718 length:567 start_codon:yes stop_codon:yes gene_type:complete